RLKIVVPQHQRDDFIGHLLQQPIALGPGYPACINQRVEKDLDIDLVVGTVYARRVVDSVGIEPSTALGVLDSPLLGDAEIRAFANNTAAQLTCVDAHLVVRAILNVLVALVHGLDVSANAGKPKQINRRPQQRLNQLSRRRLCARQSKQLMDRTAQNYPFGFAIEHLSAFAEYRPLIVEPRGTRQLKQALALHPAAL